MSFSFAMIHGKTWIDLCKKVSGMILQRIIYLSDTQTKRIAIIMREARRLTRPLLRKCIHSWLHFTVCVSYASCYTVRRSLGTTLLPSLREEVKRQEVKHHEASDEVISHTHTLIFFVSLSLSLACTSMDMDSFSTHA